MKEILLNGNVVIVRITKDGGLQLFSYGADVTVVLINEHAIPPTFGIIDEQIDQSEMEAIFRSAGLPIGSEWSENDDTIQ